MRIAIAADERTGVAGALADALTARGHDVVDDTANIARPATIEAER